MKKHLAWIFPIAFVALAVPQLSAADDGPELFVIPQVNRKPTVPAQAAAKQAAPTQRVIKKTTPVQPAVATPAPARADAVKTVPVQAGTNMRVPVQAGTNMTVPDGKTPYTVNRPITMPSQMPNNLASRSLDRILSGAGPGSIGPYQARLELRRDGTFVVTGKIEGTGTWHQSGPMIVMDSPTSHYEGKLENSLLSGTRTFKARAGIEPWRFVLNDRALEMKLQLQGR